jgi:CRISPR-associated endonuclease/helicase Cas3
MAPEGGLEPLLAPKFENGLGGWLENGGICGVYLDLPILELTRRLVASRPDWTLPNMNRLLVESATHPDRIEALLVEMGPQWRHYASRIYGKSSAEGGAAALVCLDTRILFADAWSASDEERIRTRLGGEGAKAAFTAPLQGPFGTEIHGVTLPAHWSSGLDTRKPVEAHTDGDRVRFMIGNQAFVYGREGVTREKSDVA